MLKFDSVDEMYKSIECVSSLNEIKIPVLIFSSKDDPVIE